MKTFSKSTTLGNLSIASFVFTVFCGILLISPLHAAAADLFSDTFNRTEIGPTWMVVDDPDPTEKSAWFIKDNILYQDSNIYRGGEKNTNYQGTHIVCGQTTWADYTISATVTPTDDDGWGVIIRYKNPENYYRFFTVQDKSNGGPFMRIEKFVNDVPVTLIEKVESTKKKQVYNVKVTVSGNKITVLIDNVEVLNTTDNSFNSGKAGFCTFASSIEVKDVKVTGLEGIVNTQKPLASTVDLPIKRCVIWRKSPQGEKIYFEGGKDNKVDIYQINQDGTDLKRVTNLNGDLWYFDIAPDGTIIVEDRAGDFHKAGILRILPDGKSEQITPKGVRYGHPVYSPDVKTILCERVVKYPFPELAIMKPDGSNINTLFKKDGTGIEYGIFSADGEIIVGGESFNGDGRLFFMSSEGMNKKYLTGPNSYGHCDSMPIFCPDNENIVYASSEWSKTGAFFDIVRLNLATKDKTRLTVNSTEQTCNYYPAISPDGKKIAFIRSKDGKDELCLMNIDGGGITSISLSGKGDMDKPVVQGSGILFADKFDGTEIGHDWTVVDDPDPSEKSAWFIKDNILYQDSNIYRRGEKNTNYQGTHIVCGKSTWTNYTISATVTPTDDDGWGVITRYKNPENYYRFFTVQDKSNGGPFMRIEKFVNDKPEILVEKAESTKKKQVYNVKVTVSGNKITVLLDNVEVLSASDNSFDLGKAGFCTFASSIEVKDFSVTGLANIPTVDLPVINIQPWYENPQKVYRMQIPVGWSVTDRDEKKGTDILSKKDDATIMLVCDRDGIDLAGLSVDKSLSLFEDSFKKSLNKPVITKKDFHGMPALCAVSFDAKREMTTWTTLVIYKERAYQLITVASGKEEVKTEPKVAVAAWETFEWMKKEVVQPTVRDPNAEALEMVKQAQKLYNEKKLSEVIPLCTKVLAINNKVDAAYLLRGSANYQLGNYQFCIEDMTQAIKLDSKNEQAYKLRGMAKSDIADYKGALVDYDQAVVISPKNVNILSSRAAAKQKLNDFSGAVADYDAIINIQPDTAGHYAARGYLKLQVNDINGARADFTKSLAINPNELDLKEQLAKLPPVQNNDPVKPVDGKSFESINLQEAINMPPFMNISWLTSAQPSWGNLTAAIEGMRMLAGEMTPERKKRFNKKWDTFFDCPQQPIDDYFGKLNPFLEDALCTRGCTVTAAEEFDAAMIEAILAAAQGNDAAVLEALTIADTQKAILQGLNLRLKDIAAEVKKLGSPPDPAEQRKLAAERFTLAMAAFKPDDEKAEGIWTLTDVKKADSPPTRKTGTTQTGGTYAISHKSSDNSYGVDAVYSRTDNEDKLFKYDITAEVDWMILPQVLVPAEKITLSGQLRVDPRKLGTRETAHFNPYFSISASVPNHPGCDWGIVDPNDDAAGMGKGSFGAGNGAIFLTEGKTVNMHLTKTGIIPEGGGDGDILRITISFKAGNVSSGVLNTGPLQYEFGRIERIYTYTYKQKSSPESIDPRPANDSQRLMEERIQFHNDNIKAIKVNIDYMVRDLEKITGSEAKETQLFRIRCAQSDIQHEEDMINYIRSGEYSHTRSAFEDYEYYHFIASIRENQDNLKIIQQMDSGATRLMKLAPDAVGLKVADAIKKQKLLAIRNSNPEILRKIISLVNDEVTGYWEGQRAKSEEKEIDARQNEFMAKLVVMGSGMVVTGGLTGGISKMGILMGSVNVASGPIEDAPDKFLESAVAWSSMAGFVAIDTIAGYEKGGLTGAVKSGASSLVMGLTMEFALNRLAKGFKSSGTIGKENLTPEMVTEMAIWKTFRRETAQAETLIGKYQNLTNQLKHVPAGQLGAEMVAKIEDELNTLAREVNSSYAAKLKLKGMSGAESPVADRMLSFDFAKRQVEINKVVKRDFEQAVKDKGLSWEKWDDVKGVWTKEELAFEEVRNSTSLGHNMDNDIRMLENPLFEKVFDAEINAFIMKPVAKNFVEKGGLRMPKYRLSQTVVQDGKVISKSINTYDLNKELQTIYEGSYKKITGFNARKASQTVTTHINPESYTDIDWIKDLTEAKNLKLLEGIGGQSAREVATFKSYHIGDPSMSPIMRRVSAARDTSKEIEKRLIPILRGKTPLTPEAKAQLKQQIETWENLKSAFDSYVEDPIRNYNRLSGLGQRSVPEVMEMVGTAIEAASKIK